MAQAAARCDAVVIGAGFSGIYLVHKLRSAGFSVICIEAGDDVGGTWYWNRYPGARCDVESMEYSYSFSPEIEQEWNWTERFSAQAEILSYLNFVADKLDVRKDMRFSTRVTSAAFDDASSRWNVGTDRGDIIEAQFCISAVGCLSTTKAPDFPGLESYKGEWYHTGAWPHHPVSFAGKRVGVIGTGSSGIQAIPVIASEAKELVVFQRTPSYSVPAQNAPLDPEFVRSVKADYRRLREENRHSQAGMRIMQSDQSVFDVTPEAFDAAMEEVWNGHGGSAITNRFNDSSRNIEANDRVADFVRGKIAQIVADPQTAELLQPRSYPIGTRRLCLDTDYYETYNRDNVSLVDVRDDPIGCVTEQGIKTGTKEYAFDALVFATGFDAMTGSILALNVTGRGGRKLSDEWAAGPRTYLGLMCYGFPNFFTVTGPGSPSVLSNVVVSIEQHVEWIAGCLEDMRAKGVTTIEPTLEAQDAWVAHNNEVASMTMQDRANTWYLGANIPGKPRVFMPYIGGVGVYRAKCDEVRAKGYEGFVLSA